MSNNSNMQSSIAKLLDGVAVEWKALGEIGLLIRGSGLQKKDFTETGVPAIHYGQIYTYYGTAATETKSFVSAKLAEKLKKVDTGDVVITNTSENLEDVGKAVVYLGKKQAVTGGHATIFKPSKIILGKYFVYFTQSSMFANEKRKYAKGTKVIDVSATDMSKIMIPIPPLHVQTEIVRILDTFTELTAELKAELKARKKQYDYYRDKLLTFGEDEVEWKTIEEIFYLKNGYTPSKSESKFWENGHIPWFRMEDLRENGRVLNYALQKINKIAVKGGKLFLENSIIISTSATIGEHALITVPYLSNQRFTNITLKDEYQDHFDIKFVFYYCFILCNWCKKNTTVSNFSSVDMNGFKKFKFPIPPLKEQTRIVEILDKFDAITNSLSEGLPREIALRQKQFEYYRNLLLNFPKVEDK